MDLFMFSVKHHDSNTGREAKWPRHLVTLATGAGALSEKFSVTGGERTRNLSLKHLCSCNSNGWSNSVQRFDVTSLKFDESCMC